MTEPELQLARLAGIQTCYEGSGGKKVRASSRTIRAILEALGLPSGSPAELRETLDFESSRRWRALLDPVHVFWNGRERSISLRLPAECKATLEQRVDLEDGTSRTTRLRLEQLRIAARRRVNQIDYTERDLPLPALPLGYHKLTVRSGPWWASSLLIGAPRESYSPAGHGKSWGVFAPTYALHSRTSWGAGNFSDLRRLGRWAGHLGGGTVATLPLTATFLGAPVCEPSPYSPASRLFWNEFFLDIEAIPEFSHCAAARKIVQSSQFREKLDALRRTSHVDYGAGIQLRRQVLLEMAKSFVRSKSPRRAQFERFANSHPRVRDYAAFRAVCERKGGSWRTWESRLRHGRLEAGDFSKDTADYHAYAQWCAECQIEALSRDCGRQGTGLYLDLPLGAHPDSYDLWCAKREFAVKACVGAPPDAFFSKGQNWGFAPPHPRVIRETGYGFLRECLQFQMRHAAALRIDHVMGLHRLYWIPQGLSGAEGAYVSYPAEELYALLCLESLRSETLLVGENLGTVSPEVNQALDRHHLRKMYVLPFEQRAGRREALPRPHPRSVASINTHDMPTFASHVTGMELRDRVAMGLIRKSELKKEMSARLGLVKELRNFLENNHALKGTEQSVAALLKACALWLARSPAEIVLLNLEDFWEETEPQNVPGTSTEKPNWKRKMRFSVEQIEKLSGLEEFLRRLSRERG